MSSPLNKAIELYKHSLVVLCSMAMHHKRYVAAQGIAVQESTTLPMILTIAAAILDHFGLCTIEGYLVFLKEGNIFDWDEEVEVHDFLYVLSRT